MSEDDAVRQSTKPATVESLVADLRGLGLKSGRVALVHSSLSALGWVAGGAQAVLMALMDVLTDSGTLVMPAFSGGNSEPSLWRAPPVPEEWWQTIRDNMPGFDRRLTPTRRMGAVAELFRCAADVRRSDHPACSFCAWGRYAHAITVDHRLNSGLGEDSPLARVYDLDGQVLLLGVGHDRNSSLHLAEHRADWPGKQAVKQGAAILLDKHRQWVQFDDLDTDADDFDQVGKAFEQSGRATVGKVGQGEARLMSQRALVDFGAEWIAAHRK